MNKTLKTLVIAALACLTLCGSAIAAPRGGRDRGRNPAPRHQTAKRPKAPPRQARKARPAPKKHVKRHHVAPRRYHAPRRTVHHVKHHHDNDAGWIALGGAVLGGILGGILGN